MDAERGPSYTIWEMLEAADDPLIHLAEWIRGHLDRGRPPLLAALEVVRRNREGGGRVEARAWIPLEARDVEGVMSVLTVRPGLVALLSPSDFPTAVLAKLFEPVRTGDLDAATLTGEHWCFGPPLAAALHDWCRAIRPFALIGHDAQYLLAFDGGSHG